MSWGPDADEPGRRRDQGRSDDSGFQPDAGWGDDRASRPDDDAGWGDDRPRGADAGPNDAGGWQPPPPESPAWSGEPGLRRNPQLGRDPQWGREPAADELRPLNLGDVLDGMFRIAVRHWRPFAIALSVVVVPLALLSSVALFETSATTGSFLDSFQDSVTGTTAPPDPGSIARIAGASLLSGLGSLLLTPLIYGIAVAVAASGYRDGDVEPMAAVRAAGGRYLSLLGALFLSAVAVLALLIAVPIVAGVVLGGAGADGAVTAFVVGLTILVGIVLAIIVTIRLSLTVPAVMLERAGAVDALRRSNELVRGGTARMLGILLVVGIIVSIIGFVVSLPFQIALFSGGPIGVVLATAGSIINSLLTYSLMAVAIVLLYFDRRVRTEGYDLTELARELGHETPPQW